MEMNRFQVVELTCGDRGEDPIRNMWFYTKVCPNKATKISKEQVCYTEQFLSLRVNLSAFLFRFPCFYHKHFVNAIFVFIVKVVINASAQSFVVVLKNSVSQRNIQYLRYFVRNDFQSVRLIFFTTCACVYVCTTLLCLVNSR